MKKRFLGIITVILALVMSVSCLVGCNIVTTDNERDMEQVVATVDINGKQAIKKRDLVSAYLSYGYAYVEQYGYSYEAAMDLVVDGLIQNRILVQSAMKGFEDEGKVENQNYDKNDPLRYLEQDDVNEALYHVYESFNSTIESFMDASEEDKKDTYNGEIRTAPSATTSTSGHHHEHGDVEEGIAKGVDSNSTPERRAAYNSFIELLKTNGLLGDRYVQTGNAEDTTYFQSLYTSQLESKIIERWQEDLELKSRKSVTFEDLENAYIENLDEQKEWSNAEFIAALENVSATSPILYCGYGTYGFVYNLLLGVDEYQDAEIKAITKEDPNLSDVAYSEARNAILANTIVKDLRSSWIINGYDFDYNNKTFLNQYAVAGDDSIPFGGEVKWVNGEGWNYEITVEDDKDVIEYYKLVNGVEEFDHDYIPQYAVTSVNSYTLNDFIDFMDDYVFGASALVAGATNKDVYKSVTCDADINNYNEKIQELIYAYSTDGGSLNNDKGYLVKPEVDGSNQEQYTETFAIAARDLVKAGKNGYTIVASDYGYHVIFYATKYDKDDFVSYATLTDYLNSVDPSVTDWEAYYEEMVEDWHDADSDTFLYVLASGLADVKVENDQADAVNKLVYKYRYGENKDSVKVYKNVYADLIG